MFLLRSLNPAAQISVLGAALALTFAGAQSVFQSTGLLSSHPQFDDVLVGIYSERVSLDRVEQRDLIFGGIKEVPLFSLTLGRESFSNLEPRYIVAVPSLEKSHVFVYPASCQLCDNAVFLIGPYGEVQAQVAGVTDQALKASGPKRFIVIVPSDDPIVTQAPSHLRQDVQLEKR
ncbi:MAG: hypothetical protein U0517_02510 [Candidatus Andersenbacteria bacterium]